MSSQSKIRFYADSSGKRHELFSMFERPNGESKGDVEIFVKRSGEAQVELQNKEINHERISIHRSQNSSGTTIKRTFIVGDKEISTVALIENSQEKLLWPVMGNALPDLVNSSPLLKDKSRDKKVCLMEYFDNRWTLMYFIFVQRKGGKFKAVKRFNLHVEKFEYFDVGIYTTYLFIPNGNVGFISTLMTSKPRIEGEHFGPFLKNNGAPSSSPEMLHETVLQFCEFVARNQTRRFVEKHHDFPYCQEIADAQSSKICNIPLTSKNHNSLDYGTLHWSAPLNEINEFGNFFKFYQ